MTTTHLVQLIGLLAILAAVVVPVLIGSFLAAGDPVGDGGPDAAMAEAREFDAANHPYLDPTDFGGSRN